ncbi:phosphatase PAP2 family protein [Pseudotabrizicola sp. 4114]|uniref:phosphatase PAP2 family protein n=1 Tax=Pseudotabrizicola sp. 4114 TaxID=2817731 RepID=UPI00285C8518|nr:lipid A 4'-phosphatase [Pseudorhodobacter sp. 4114]
MSDFHIARTRTRGRNFAIINADRLTSHLLASILLSFAVFAIWPAIDLRVSQAFHDPLTGFVIDGHPLTEALRLAVWILAILLCLAATVGTVLGTAGREVLLPTRAWGFILTLFILGPGVMVEMLTKPHWGRVRPAQVTEFGGSLHFSPPNEMVDFCTRNCSFVSGEVSGTTVTALALLLIRFHLRHRLHKTVSIVLLAAALGLPLAIALQRVAAGRHFLSDTVFALLFTLLLAMTFSALLRPFLRRVHSARPKQNTVSTDHCFRSRQSLTMRCDCCRCTSGYCRAWVVEPVG